MPRRPVRAIGACASDIDIPEGMVNSTTRRLSESAGMLMIGDGVLGLLHPREHCLLWRGGPQWWRESIDWFAARPHLARALAATELAAGLWIARRQEPRTAALTPQASVS